MSEATINIPAEQVEHVRYQLMLSLTEEGETIGHGGGLDGAPPDEKEERMREAVANILVIAAAIERVGWPNDWHGVAPDDRERELTTDRATLAVAIQRGLEYATDDVGRAPRDELIEHTERIRWFSETLDSLEPEAVPA